MICFKNQKKIFLILSILFFWTLSVNSNDNCPTIDVNQDSLTNLSDVIVLLQTLSGGTFEHIDPKVIDIDDSSKTYLPEIIYILKRLSGLISCSERDRIKVPTQYSTISEAIDKIQPGGIIEVAEGSYNEKITINKAIFIKGSGMDKTEINISELDYNTPVISIIHDNVTISGFKITGGYPGIEIKGNNVLIEKNSIVKNNRGFGPNESGGYIEEGSNGIGIIIEADNCTIKNNLIVKNGITWDGGGLGVKAFSASELRIINNTICENSGANGASCGSGYGIRAKDSTGNIFNNIIANNDALGTGPGCKVKGYGIYLEGSSTFEIDYNNVWDNDDTGFTPEINNYFNSVPGNNDISQNPLFVDNTYFLQPSSPCIDSGDPSYFYSNEPTPNGLAINIGAFGNTLHATSTLPIADAGLNQDVIMGDLVLLDGSKSRVGKEKPQSYKWELILKPDNSNAILSNSTLKNPTFVADKDGIYKLSLIVSDGIIASSPSTVTITAIYYEDFSTNSAINWVPVNGNWSTANNNYLVSSSTTEMSTSYFDKVFSFFELEVKVTKISGENDNISIFFNGDPSTVGSSGNWDNGYKFTYGSGDWQLSKVKNGDWSSIKGWTSSYSLNNKLGEWNIVKIVRTPNYIDIYINGSLQRSLYDTTLISGKIGVCMYDKYKNGQAKFDYVSIKQL